MIYQTLVLINARGPMVSGALLVNEDQRISLDLMLLSCPLDYLTRGQCGRRGRRIRICGSVHRVTAGATCGAPCRHRGHVARVKGDTGTGGTVIQSKVGTAHAGWAIDCGKGREKP